MSVKAMTWVFEHSPYTLGARLVHLAMADVANDAHDNRLWMKQEELAAKAGLSVSQVGRILPKMVEDGVIKLIERGCGRGKPSVYQLVMEAPQYAGFSEKAPQPRRENPASGAIAPLVNSNQLKDSILDFPIPDDFSDRMAEVRSLFARPTGKDPA